MGRPGPAALHIMPCISARCTTDSAERVSQGCAEGKKGQMQTTVQRGVLKNFQGLEKRVWAVGP